MRRTVTAGSSLLLAIVLPAFAQEGPSDEEIHKRLKALAVADDSSREQVLKFFDNIRLWDEGSLLAAAWEEGRGTYEAAWRRLPHVVWCCLLEPKTSIGSARQIEKDLFGADPKPRPGDFARAAQRLLEDGDRGRKLWALRILGWLPAPEPSKLCPLLEGGDQEMAQLAAKALERAPDPSALPIALKLLRSAPIETSYQVAPLVATLGTSELTPELVDILKTDPTRFMAVGSVLARIGDSRAEPALLGLLGSLRSDDLYLLVKDILPFVGGPDTITALRKFRSTLPADDRMRAFCLETLVALRDPMAARDILAEARDGKVDLLALGYCTKILARLGDRSIVNDLTAILKDRKVKIDDRKAAIELIGLLGNSDHVAALSGYLKDQRYSYYAALALAELGDGGAVKPLVEALESSATSSSLHALMILPLRLDDVETPLVRILDDPEGHRDVVRDAVKIAARVGGTRLKAKLLDMLFADNGFLLIGKEELAVTIVPLLNASDRPRLLKGRSADRSEVSGACTIAMAGMGDPEALKGFVRLVIEGRLHDFSGKGGNMLLVLQEDPPGLLPAVKAVFKENPTWFDGAEYLALHGKPDGKKLLEESLRRPTVGPRDRACRALSRLGERAGISPILRMIRVGNWRIQDEDRVHAMIEESDLPYFRELAWCESAAYPGVFTHILARRGDKAMEPWFRHVARSNDEGGAATALAHMGARNLKGDLLRMLRSESPQGRAEAARCLGTMGDTSSIHALAPLLDDLEWLFDNVKEHVFPNKRVCEVVAESIEALAGQSFPCGSRFERAAAAKAWYERQRSSLK